MKAYITLLSTSSYLPGVLALARSLRRTGTRHSLVVAVSAAVPDGALRVLEAHHLATLRLPAGGAVPRPVHQHHHWDHTFDKLHLFGLTQFEKLVYLDSDMMLLCQVDALFGQPHLAAVAAGRHRFPDWTRLNSGLMVIEPQAGLPQRIGQMLDTAHAQRAAAGRPAVGDQDLINAFYPDWPERGAHLDEGCNLFHEHVDGYLAAGLGRLPRRPDEPGEAHDGLVKVIHFIGRHKPWQPRAVLRHLARRVARRIGPAEAATFVDYLQLLRLRGSGVPAPALRP